MRRSTFGRAPSGRKAYRAPTSQESKLRPALEKVAKKVYETASPTVEKITDTVKKGTVKVLDGYLKGTDAIAAKLKPILEKLPKVKAPSRHGRRTGR